MSFRVTEIFTKIIVSRKLLKCLTSNFQIYSINQCYAPPLSHISISSKAIKLFRFSREWRAKNTKSSTKITINKKNNAALGTKISDQVEVSIPTISVKFCINILTGFKIIKIFVKLLRDEAEISNAKMFRAKFWVPSEKLR